MAKNALKCLLTMLSLLAATDRLGLTQQLSKNDKTFSSKGNIYV
jgi:hypothetical protein